jgi:hypothetical protein
MRRDNEINKTIKTIKNNNNYKKSNYKTNKNNNNNKNKNNCNNNNNNNNNSNNNKNNKHTRVSAQVKRAIKTTPSVITNALSIHALSIYTAIHSTSEGQYCGCNWNSGGKEARREERRGGEEEEGRRKRTRGEYCWVIRGRRNIKYNVLCTCNVLATLKAWGEKRIDEIR